MMYIRVLGPIDAVEGTTDVSVGELVDVSVGGPVERRIAAMLVATAPAGVAIDAIAENLWGEDPPDDPRQVIEDAVADLRDALGESAILETGSGFRLGDVATDAARFEQMVADARMTIDPAAAQKLWGEAVGLWRGRAFEDARNLPATETMVQRLEVLYLEATDAWIDARLANGEAHELATDVEASVLADPLREGYRAQQMLVLARTGRAAEAHETFQEFRAELTSRGGAPSATLAGLAANLTQGMPVHANPSPGLRGYRISERLGEGAFSIVYRAVQESVGREVAVKQIRAELANRPEFIRQFESEAQLIGRLEHPRIVPLYDYWREPGSAYLVMRYLRGGSLADALNGESLPLDDVVRIVQQVADALDEAHGHGIVHRDIKPANILLDDDGRAYLSDFGIALEEAADVNPEAWLSKGSPAYASPEQLRRERVGPAADIHGLAISVFESLTGRIPFPEQTTWTGLLERQLNDPIPLVRTLRPQIPAAVDTVLQKASAKRAGDRHDSATEFAHDLAVAAGLEPALPNNATDGRNPYKGLRAFDEADAGDFVGRERLIAKLIDACGQSRMTAVLGPSGSGKSSVVRAGLLPAVRAGQLDGSARWFVTTMIPGTDPFSDLAAALRRIAVAPPRDLTTRLRSGSNGLARMVDQLVPRDRELLLVIDQFEELFTFGDAAQRTLFLDGLVEAVTATDARLRVVFTIRADFFDHPLRHNRFAELIEASTVQVHPLAADELERAIAEPARSVGVSFEPGLVAKMTADVTDQPGALPLLQYTLTELFDRREGAVLTIDVYDELGGVAGALVRRAEELFDAASNDERAMIRRVFGRLISLGDGTEDTRRRVVRSELGNDDVADSVIDRFAQARLLSADRDAATREPTVEIAHEALIREWPRLSAWLDDDRDSLRVLRHLTETSTAWDSRGRDEADLYRGGRLEAASELASDHPDDLNETERSFVVASQEREVAERDAERLTNSRLRRLLAGVGVVAVLALIAGGLALQQRQTANDQASRANNNAERADEQALLATENASRADELRANAEQAQAEAQAATVALSVPEIVSTSSAELGYVLAAMSLSHAATAKGREALLATSTGITPVALVPRSEAIEGVSRFDGIRIINGIGINPDGTRIAVPSDRSRGSLQGAVTIYDETGEQLEELLGFEARVNQLDWAPKGNVLAAVDSAGRARVLSTEPIEVLMTYDGQLPAGELFDVAWSLDGELLATAGNGTDLHLWSPDTGELAHVLQVVLPDEPAQTFRRIAFHPDGRRLLAAGWNWRTKAGFAAMWDVTTDPPTELTIVEQPVGVRGLDLAEDGLSAAVSWQDGSVGTMTIGNNTLRFDDRRYLHNSASDSISFSPSEDLLISTSSDETIRISDRETLAPLSLPRTDHTSAVKDLRFFNDTSAAASVDYTGELRLWELIDDRDSFPVSTVEPMTALVTSGDSSYVAGPTGLFALDGRGKTTALGTDPIERLVALTEGRLLAVNERTTRLLNGSGEQTWERELAAPVIDVSVDPTTQHLALVDTDGQLYLGPWEEPAAILQVPAPVDTVKARFTSSGRHLVVWHCKPVEPSEGDGDGDGDASTEPDEEAACAEFSTTLITVGGDGTDGAAINLESAEILTEPRTDSEFVGTYRAGDTVIGRYDESGTVVASQRLNDGTAILDFDTMYDREFIVALDGDGALRFFRSSDLRPVGSALPTRVPEARFLTVMASGTIVVGNDAGDIQQWRISQDLDVPPIQRACERLGLVRPDSPTVTEDEWDQLGSGIPYSDPCTGTS